MIGVDGWQMQLSMANHSKEKTIEQIPNTSKFVGFTGSGDDHAKPTVLVRKPRTRRLLRSLLCCFGAEPKGEHEDGAGPFVPSSSGIPMSPTANTTVNGAQPQPYSPKASEKLLLPPLRASDSNKPCLIIDLDETLVHSSFKPVKNPDFVIPVEIDGVVHQVYVLKRPHVDEFLRRIGDLFECILFTASLAKYADPVADLLDKWGVFRARLFREACVFHKGNYVKDLNRLGRDLKRVIIVDNSPASYAFHPENAIPVQSWFDDMSDTELLDQLPLLERLAHVDNVYPLLRQQHSHTTTTTTNTVSSSPNLQQLTNNSSSSPITSVVQSHNNNNNSIPPPSSSNPITQVTVTRSVTVGGNR